MSDLDSIVQVSITLESAAIDVAGFGVPLVLGHHSAFADVVRSYEASTALADLVADGIPSTSRIYQAVAAIMSATPRVAEIKVGKSSTAVAQITHVTPSSAANDTVYSCKVNGTVATFTSDGTALLAEICTGLAAAIDALPLVTATSDGTKVIVATTLADSTATINTPVMVKIDDATVATGLAADLDAIVAVDDGWYALAIASCGNADKLAVSAWVEAHTKIFGTTLQGTRAGDVSDTTDTATTLGAYLRTFWQYHSDPSAFSAEKLMGQRLPSDPSYGKTWAFRQTGTAPESLSTTFKNAVKSKGGNVLETRAGVAINMPGVMAEGGRFVDQTTLIDELTARIQERVYAALLNDLPYTNESADAICGEILGELQTHVDRGSIAASPKPTCTFTPVENVSSVNRAARHLPDIVFAAQTAGRIHSVAIQGKLTV